MQLSIRLSAVARLTHGAVRLADIGTDHAYIPIYLVKQERIAHAIAMDVNEGPLLRAREHIRRYGLERQIETRLSDGARELAPGEADTAVIAGMGGALTVKILTEGQKQLQKTETLVLQPQSEIEEVRRFLHADGFSIVGEDMVKDDGKYYPMMRVCRGAQEPWEDFEYCFGKHLLEHKNACLGEFLQREERICEKILDGLKGKDAEHIERRRGEVIERYRLIVAAKKKMNIVYRGGAV